jgi:hypothetical protein
MKNRIESLEGELTPLKPLRLDLKTKRLVIRGKAGQNDENFLPFYFPAIFSIPLKQSCSI